MATKKYVHINVRGNCKQIGETDVKAGGVSKFEMHTSRQPSKLNALLFLDGRIYQELLYSKFRQ